MAEAIVSVVLESFRDLIVEEAKLLSGVSIRIESLEAELERMMSFLKDADARHHESDGVRTWIKQVRNLAYRAQDILEKYAIQVTSQKKSGIKKLLRKFACINIHNIGSEIESIKSEIINLRESLRTYGIKTISEGEQIEATNEKHRMLRETFAHVEDAYFVGMHDDINNLVFNVVAESEDKIISVYGMGGSGKTTVARKVFNHPQVQQVFDAFAWVCITQSCEKMVVLQDILKQLTSGHVQSTNFSELVRDIAEVVHEKKCFVVLDDIWNVYDWKILSRAFVDARIKSKVLITTRKYNVAKVGVLHNQRLLDEEESLQLLQNKAFNNQNEHIDPSVEKLLGDLGREMIRKCGGLPLAISALGGILRSKFSVNEWMDINKHIGSTLSQGLDDLEDSETTDKVLGLSYQDLPHFLKPCFLYMSAFREDRIINPRKLYHMWIAEGLVSPGYLMPGETLMNVAERFLQELNFRCMVQLQMDRIQGNIESCRLHDLMRDLCLKKAKEDEFLERIGMDIQGGQVNRIDTSIGDNAHRLVVDLYTDEEDSKCVEVFDHLTRHQFVRYISLCGKISYPWDFKYTVEASQATRFKLLRVLDFESLQFCGKKLPNDIGKLIHLRFLSLYNCDIEELPSSVGDLTLLQTLDLRVRYGCIMIPYDIFSKKNHLRHLYLREFATIGPSTKKLKLDGLSELESLIVSEDISKLDITGLSRLVNMRCFNYSNVTTANNDWRLLMEQIKNWKRIKLLHIRLNSWDDGEDISKIFMSGNITHMSFAGCKLNFPRTYEPLFCQNLVSLKIKRCEQSEHVDDELMKFLGKLPNLRKFMMISSILSIREFNFTEMASFPQLKLLQLYCKKLIVSAESLPNLIVLKIGHCEEIVPEDGLKYLHNLEELCVLKDHYASEFKDKCWKHHLQYPHISIKEVDPKSWWF